MNTVDTALVTIGIMFVVTNFQGVGKENEMVKVDVGRVIVKTVNWSSWTVLGTLLLLFANAYVGSLVTGHLLGMAIGCYLVGCMVIAMTAWINDNPFKKLPSADKDTQGNTNQQVVVEGSKA